jgi:hypothetical protein
VYRARLFSTAGLAIWDNAWYGGHYLLGYSLIFPPLGALLGVRWTGVIAVVISTLLFARLARRLGGFRVRAATVLFALGATGDLFIGRITFAVGVTFGLAAVLACVRGSRIACVVCSLACAAASPVAAAFLVMGACADFSAHRTRARAGLLGVPAACLVLALILLFPEGGYEPFALSSLLAAGGATVVLLLLLRPADRLLRHLAWLYLAALVLAYVVRSPMGSNAVRFGVLFAPAALAGRVGVADVQRAFLRLGEALRRRRPHSGARLAIGRAAATGMLGLLGTAGVLWQAAGPIDQSVGASLDPASHYDFYVPAIDYLETQSGGQAMRIEVPFTSSHWDATFLSRSFLLARGWERQLDTRYDALFYTPAFTAAAYQAWLLDNAVAFVALSSAPPDFSSVREAALIRGGLPFLHSVYKTARWQIYAVIGARPLASGPGSLTRVDADGFRLSAARSGRFVVRVHYTPYWTATAGVASVSRAPGGWTEVVVGAPGVVTIAAKLPDDLRL